MSITIKQFDGSSVTPKDDAILYDLIMGGQAGKFYGLEVTSLGGNQIHVSAGILLIKGREIVIDEETISVELSTDGDKLGQLYLHIDLSNTTTPAEWMSEAVDTLTELTQDDAFNHENGVWETQICTYDVSETEISNMEVKIETVYGRKVANNLTTTAEGYALDARQGAILNSNLENKIIGNYQIVFGTVLCAFSSGIATVTLPDLSSNAVASGILICNVQGFGGECSATVISGTKTAKFIAYDSSGIALGSSGYVNYMGLVKITS